VVYMAQGIEDKVASEIVTYGMNEFIVLNLTHWQITSIRF